METSNPGKAHKGNPADTVSQSEVENLLAQVSGGDSSSPDETLSKIRSKESDTPEKFHFREQSSLSSNELRKLRLRHDEFIRALAARLSTHFRFDAGLQMSRLETSPFRKFVEGTSNPTFLSMFRLEPLQGVCFLDIPPRIALYFVNRELGGSGQPFEEPRPFTEIESRLLSKIVEIIAGEWCSFWRDLLDLRPVLVGHETNGDFIQACPPDTVMLVLGIQIQIGELSEQIQFAFPSAMLDPLLLKLNTETKAAAPVAAPQTQTPKWNPVFDNVKIKITARLANLKMTAKQVAQLQPGNVLLLSSEMVSQAQLCLADKPKFTAAVGSKNGCWAAKIVEPLKS